MNENSAVNANVGAKFDVDATDYWPLSFTLGGADASKFKLHTDTGYKTAQSAQIQVATTTLDYESKSTYKITLRVVENNLSRNLLDGTYHVTIFLNDVSEPPAAPAAPSVAANATTPTTKLDVSWTAPTMTGKPAITDYDVQYRKAGDSTWTLHAMGTTTATSTTLSSLTSGKSYEVQVRATNHEGTSAWSATGSGITTAGGVTRSIAENSAAGTSIGAAVTATSTNTSYTYTHALGGTDAASFDIVASSGQIQVKSALDYETKSSYSVTVTVTATAKAGANSQSLDPNAPGAYSVPVTINVTDVNEPPAFPSDTASRSVAENSSAGTNVGAVVSATDPDSGDKLEYSISGTDAASFDFSTTTGQITVKSALDYESKTSYSVTISVTDNKKADHTADSTIDDTITVTINVTDVNEPPVKLAAPSVSANATTPTSKIDVSWTALTTAQMSGKPAVNDYDVQYRLAGATNWTEWNASNNSTTTSATITGLTSNKSYEVQVRAVNAEGNGPWSDSDSAITTGGGVTRSVAENSAAGANVGSPVTADSNPNSYTLTHTLSGTDAGKFEIGSGTGQITVKTGTSLNYEAKTSYSVVVTVTAASAGANSQSLDPNAPGDYTVPVTINVNDVNEPPAKPDAPRVSQHSPTPKTELDVNWDAPDMTGKPAVNDYDIQYKKTASSTWSTWSHNGTATSARLTGLAEGTSYDVQVMAKNDEGSSAWSDSGTATTQDKNVHAEFPSATATRSVAENTAAGTNIGAAFTATDTEGHTLTYSLTGTDAASFDLATSSGQLKVKAALDYESKVTYKVTVGVSDNKDTNDNPDTVVDDTIEVTISVTDVNEPPPAPDAPTVTANSASPTSKIDVSWSAPDMSGKPALSDYDVQYRLSGDSGWTDASFSGTETSVTLSGLAAGKSYEVQVRATNAEGTGAWSDSGVAITKAGGVTRSVKENSGPGTKVGKPVTATTSTAYTYSHALSGTDAGKFTIVSSTGQIKVKSGTKLDYETKKTYSVIVTVTAAAKSGANAQSLDPNAPGDYIVPVTINVLDVNEAPEFSDGATTTRSVDENSAAGTKIGAVVSATDNDGDTLYYSLTGTDASSFTLSASTGQLSVKAALDHEAKATYSVTVQVSDRLDSTDKPDTKIDDTIKVTINVGDVNEPPAAPDGPIVVQNTDTPKTQLDVSWTPPDMTGKPPITDYDVRYKKTATSTWSSRSHTGTATSTTITSLTEGTTYHVQVRASNHEGISAWSATSTAKTQDKNVNSESRSATTTRSVDENSPAGTSVGAPVTGTDTENDPLTYSLSGTDAASFDIGTSTGQIMVKAALDYEANASYSVIVEMTDGKDSLANPDPSIDATTTVDIIVNDVNEPPAAPAAPRVSAHSQNGTSTLNVHWSAPDMTGKPAITSYDLQYRESGDTAWTYYRHAGLNTAAAISALNPWHHI